MRRQNNFDIFSFYFDIFLLFFVWISKVLFYYSYYIHLEMKKQKKNLFEVLYILFLFTKTAFYLFNRIFKIFFLFIYFFFSGINKIEDQQNDKCFKIYFPFKIFYSLKKINLLLSSFLLLQMCWILFLFIDIEWQCLK